MSGRTMPGHCRSPRQKEPASGSNMLDDAGLPRSRSQHYGERWHNGVNVRRPAPDRGKAGEIMMMTIPTQSYMPRPLLQTTNLLLGLQRRPRR